MTTFLFILAAIGSQIGKFLIGCIIFCGVVWIGMLLGQRNDEMKRLKDQNEELRKKQKHQDAHIQYLQKNKDSEEDN